MSSLKQRLDEDVKAAMRAREKEKLATLRMIAAALKQREVDERIELDDTGVLQVLDRLAKQHRDSIEQFSQAGRNDLVEKEQFELSVVQGYLPEPLDEAQLDALIDQAIAETGAAQVKDMGRVMAVLKPQVQGRAEMSAVGARVKSRLG